MACTRLLIPARYRSTRLPAKPLRLIHDEPMIVWTARQGAKAVQSGLAKEYCVATDDARIYRVCQERGIPAVITDGDHATGTDRLAQAAEILGYAPDDVVINLQGDEPLLPMRLLRQVRDLLLEKSDCAMATLCEPIDSAAQFLSPSVVKVATAGRVALYFSRAPIAYCRDDPAAFEGALRHLGVYAYRARLLQDFARWPMGDLERRESLEQLRVLENGQKIAIDVAAAALPLGVDTQADLDRLNATPKAALLAMQAQ